MTIENNVQRDGLGVTSNAQYEAEFTEHAEIKQVVVGPEVARAMGTSNFTRLPNGMYETQPEPAPSC